MSTTAQRLYELLPAIYRLRDAAHDEPLEQLLALVAEQVEALEENLAQLYDDQFIETCADWAAPYIGDLIGYRSLHGVVPRVASPRAEVANTVRLRRRKGTAAMLEQLARDVTGWHARAVEFFELLATTQHMNHVRPHALATASLRDSVALEQASSPSTQAAGAFEKGRGTLAQASGAFDRFAHTLEVRKPARGGRYNVPNVGLFLWRIQAWPLMRAHAAPDPSSIDGKRFRFRPLGIDAPLFTAPQTEDEITHLAEPVNVPMPIGLRVMDARLADYYGPGKSVSIELAGATPADPPTAVAADVICVCDLRDVLDGSGNVVGWAHPAPAGKVAIDPALGRIAFSDAPSRDVLVSFRYGFSAPLGGGEYERGAVLGDAANIATARRGDVLQPLLDAAGAGGTVEIVDSARYSEGLAIAADPGAAVTLQAANGARPLLTLAGDVELHGGDGAALELNGLVIEAGALKVSAGGGNALKRLRLVHCTLVPGLARDAAGNPSNAGAPSLIAELPDLEIELDHCITGPLRVARGATVRIRDSIVDAGAEDAIAYAGPGGAAEGAPLELEACTVIGRLHALSLEVSNSILAAAAASGDPRAPVLAERRQGGCVRFSWLPIESRTPRRYRCQPVRADAPRMRPQFTSLRYGDPGYAQLARVTPLEIRRGADDEGEMGALHELHAPQREINLRVRLEEYLRFGLDAGIFYAS